MKTPTPTSTPTLVTRRRFLGTGALALAGGMFFPHVARSNPLGAHRRIRMALIGCGKIMEGHRGWAQSHPEVEVVAVCDVKTPQREEALQLVKKSNPSAVGYVDYGDIMARGDIDAVIIATPDHWHAAISIDAMRTGKDVYVEKPMALTLDEAAAMVEAEHRYGRILQVGSQQRCNRVFRQAVNIIRNGWIGEIREIHVYLPRDFAPERLLPAEPVPADIDYDRWIGPAPMKVYNANRVRGVFNGGWRVFWDYGSRINGDWGAHLFDIVQWALGMDDSGPVLFVPQGFEGTPHQYHQYANGLKVTASKGLGAPSFSSGAAGENSIHFIGQEGEVRVNPSTLETTPPALASKLPSSGDFRADGSSGHRENWLDSIISRRPPICPATIGGRTFDICALAGITERLDRPVRWNPEQREIVDDPQAARFAEYPRRAGYPLPV
jgi:predicted dehydrogenase